MTRSVMMRPGRTTLTVMPSLARSPARVLNSPATAGRMPLESMSPSTGCFTELDWIVRMRPHPAFFMCGSTSRIRRTTERCTCAKAACHCSSVSSAKGPGGGPPALATRMSTPPRVSADRATTRRMSSARAASALMASASAPVLIFTSAAASWSAASPRAHMTTRAPSAASPMAQALPMPRLAAITSATFPLSPRSMPSDLLVEVGPVSAGHVHHAQLVVPEHFQGDPLARPVPPQAQVEFLPRRHLPRVERHDHVALLDARTRARTVRHDPRDHDPFLEWMGEDAQPGALGPAHHPPVAEQLLAVRLVALRRDRQRVARDLAQVEVDHTHHLPEEREERPAPEARIGGARHDAPFEKVLPVRFELPEVGHGAAGDPALARAEGGHGEYGGPARDPFRGDHGRNGQALALHLEQGEADVEVLGDDLGSLRSPALERDLDGLPSHHDVVHGQ